MENKFDVMSLLAAVANQSQSSDHEDTTIVIRNAGKLAETIYALCKDHHMVNRAEQLEDVVLYKELADLKEHYKKLQEEFSHFRKMVGRVNYNLSSKEMSRKNQERERDLRPRKGQERDPKFQDQQRRPKINPTTPLSEAVFQSEQVLSTPPFANRL